jgi:hypothetical protein
MRQRMRKSMPHEGFGFYSLPKIKRTLPDSPAAQMPEPSWARRILGDETVPLIMYHFDSPADKVEIVRHWFPEAAMMKVVRWRE